MKRRDRKMEIEEKRNAKPLCVVRMELHGAQEQLALLGRFDTMREAHDFIKKRPDARLMTTLQFDLYKGRNFEYISLFQSDA